MEAATCCYMVPVAVWGIYIVKRDGSNRGELYWILKELK